MSKVPYTVNIDEYICSSLEYIRKMYETRDFSGLLAEVERIQAHANRMESAIHESFSQKYRVFTACEDDELSDKEFRKKIKKIMKVK